MLDASGRFIHVCASFCAILGRTSDDLVGEAAETVLKAPLSPRQRGRIAVSLRRGDVARLEVGFTAHTGVDRQLDIALTPIMNASGEFDGCIMQHLDVTESRRREAASKQHLEELQTVLDALPAFVFYKDDANRIIRLNDAAAHSIGGTVASIEGEQTEAFFPAEDAAAFARDDMQVLRTGRPKLGIVEPYEATPGERRLVRTDKFPLADLDGNYTRLVAIATDVTEQHETEERLRLAIDASDAVLWDWNLVTHRFVLSGSPSHLGLDDKNGDGAEDGTRTTRDLVTTPRNVLRSIHTDDRPLVVDELRQCLHNPDHACRVECRVWTARRVWRWILLTGRVVLQDDDGSPLRMIGQQQDIDARRRAEESLLEREERLERAVSGSSDGLWDYNPANGACWYADRFHTLLGYEPGTMEERVEAWVDRMHPDDRNPTIVAMLEHLNDRVPFDAECRLRTRTGSYRWFRLRGEAVRDRRGRPLRVAGSVSDIDSLKRVQRKLETASLDARSANQAKSEFLANMSHEIRTPMTAILGFAGLLEEHLDQPDDHFDSQAVVRTIRRNGEQLLSLINDILDVSRIEAGRMTTNIVRTSIVDIVHDVVELMDVRAAEKGITLNAVFDGDIPGGVETDPLRLRQILVNLVGNATKFTEEGSVTIRTSFDGPRSDMHAVISVTDTGIGLNADQCSTIFAAFTQADCSAARAFGGSGLGLHISQRLAERLGGTITVDSEPGIGSTFTVRIGVGDLRQECWQQAWPASEETGTQATNNSERIIASMQSPRLPTRRQEDAEPLVNRRVLVAEDGPDNQRLIAHHLIQLGMHVDIVPDGQAAVDAVVRTQEVGRGYDFVLMDMQMPVMDGYNATRTIRGLGIQTPIIALTAHAMNGNRERCLAAGCDEYATKPIDRGTLAGACLRGLIRRPSGVNAESGSVVQ